MTTSELHHEGESDHDALVRVTAEWDAARVECEELRAVLTDLLAYDVAHLGPRAHRRGCECGGSLDGMYPCGADRQMLAHAAAIIGRGPTVAALRAHEALAALAWCESFQALNLSTDHDKLALETVDRATVAYREARAAREAAEKRWT